MLAQSINGFLLRIKALFRRRRLDHDIDDEFHFHLDQRTEENIAAGMAPDEARRAARLSLGNPVTLQEETREVWSFHFLESLLQDVRYGLRQLRRNRGFAVAAILTLALGIGANTAIFSVANAVLVRALPFRDPGRLVVLFLSPERSKGIMGDAASGPDVVDWQRESRSFTAIAATTETEGNLTGAGAPQHVQGEKVTANYFDVLGVQPALGRTFARGEDKPGRDHEIVLSYNVWRTAFGGGGVLGRAIQLDDRAFIVIGVMPATFHDPRTWANPEARYWIPLPRPQLNAHRGDLMYAAFGRLRPGVSLTQAQQEMNVIGRREAKEFPGTNARMGILVSPLAEVNLETFDSGRFHSVRPAILLLQFAAAFLLLIACANVANLLLFRQVGRQREMALRGAMGAGRWRLARQLLTESVMLSLLGGSAGVLLAIWCKDALVGLAPKGYLPPTANVSLDWSVLAFALGLAALSGILFGSFPALRAARQDINGELKGAGTGAARSPSMPRVRRALVVFELATTFVLLVGGGLMARSLASLLSVNPGFQPRDFFTARLSLPGNRYPKPDQIVRFFTTVQERVARLPGVEAAAFTSAPEFVVNTSMGMTVDHRGGLVQLCWVTPGFFRAAGVPLIAGRDFSASDVSEDAPVAIVNQSFGRHFWPHLNPLGRSWGSGKSRTEVVGLVGNVRQMGLGASSLPEIYFPVTVGTAAAQMAMNVVVRSSTPPALLAREIERQVWAIDPQIPLSGARTGDQIVGDWAGYLHYRAVLLGSFAILGLLIAVVGIFGATAYTTARRTHEIGIRMALGAEQEDVLRMIVLQGVRLVLIGLGVGVGGALALTRIMTSLLYGVTPTDPITFLGVALLLGLVALVACYVPVRRAMRVDPVTALKYE